MASCLLCTSSIWEDAQYYMTSDIGPEITSTVELTLGHEILGDSIICAQCFSNIVRDMATTPSRDALKPLDCDVNKLTNVCVYCKSSLYDKVTRLVGESHHRQFIAEKIAPRTIPQGSRVCYPCWILITSRLKEQGTITSTPTNSIDTCVWCEVSLATRRRHSIPEGPERDEIAQSIYPRQIPLSGLICYACWQRARRIVQKRINLNNQSINTADSSEPGLSQSSNNTQECVWCKVSLFRRRTHLLQGKEREDVAARVFPIELPKHALVCSPCWSQVQENVYIIGRNIEPRTNTTMTLDNYYHTANTSRCCFVSGCQNSERLRVPEYIRKVILKHRKIFVTDYARICAEHKTVINWNFLDQSKFSNSFTKTEMESMLKLAVNDLDYCIRNVADADFCRLTSADGDVDADVEIC